MSNQPPEDAATQLATCKRPEREHVFYANAFNFAYNEQQEAILDFKLVMPEDFKFAAMQTVEEGGEEVTKGSVSINLSDVPIGVRVYMPMNQFLMVCQRLGKVWQKFQLLETEQGQNKKAHTPETKEA